MLIAPEIDVIGKQVGDHPQRSHATVLRLGGRLAMFHGVAVIPARALLQGIFDGIDEDLGGGIAVAVRVDLVTGAMECQNDLFHLFRGKQ